MDEIFVKEKNHTQDRGTEKIKAKQNKTNITKLKAQVELLEDRATHNTTKYLEIDQELLTEIKELCFTITQFLSEL